MLAQLREYFTGGNDPKVSAEELSIFTRQFATMLDSGISLVHALDCFCDEGMTGENLSKVITHVTHKVNSGFRLSRAMRMYPKVFNPVYCGLVETGESTGQLTDVLLKLADLLEKQVKMQKRVVSTLTYPAVLFTVSCLSISVFIFFVLPMLEPIFFSMKMTLPLPTRILLHLRHAVPVLFAGGVGLFIAFTLGKERIDAWMAKEPEKARFIHRLPLSIPVLGPLMQRIIITRILYSLASMIDTGLGIVQALNGCITVAGNQWIAFQIKLAQKEIVDGRMLSEAFAEVDIFPPSAVHVIRAGEETSSLSNMLTYAANMYDEDTEIALDQLASTLEPLLMIGMGLVVGFIVLSSMLPTIQLIQNL